MQEEFLGEESLGGKYMGEKSVQEEFLGEDSLGGRYMGGMCKYVLGKSLRVKRIWVKQSCAIRVSG